MTSFESASFVMTNTACCEPKFSVPGEPSAGRAAPVARTPSASAVPMIFMHSPFFVKYMSNTTIAGDRQLVTGPGDARTTGARGERRWLLLHGLLVHLVLAHRVLLQ